MRNRRGFAQIFLLAVLPFILGALIFLYFWLTFLRLETTLRNHSRRIQIAAQDRSRHFLRELLGKNDGARRLKLEYEWAHKAWLAAIAGGNPVSIAAAEARLERIMFQRQALDFEQKTLIQAANSDLRLSSEKLYGQISGEVRKLKLLRDSFLIDLTPLRPEVPRLAVIPVSPDIAPEYRTQEAFSKRQALAQKWQYRIRVAPPLNRFFPGEARFQNESRITLSEEGQGSWRIENRTDKF